MICGEYAVLRGQPAIAVAVERRLTVDAAPAADDLYRITSNLWDRPLVTANLPEDSSELLVKVCRWVQSKWQLPPFHLEVRSAIRITDGLGSSSALILGVLSSLAAAFELAIAKDMIAPLSCEFQRDQQKFASGYDFATQSVGGIVTFTPTALFGLTERVANSPHLEIQLLTGGRGAPTTQVGGDTIAWLDQAPGAWQQLQQRSTTACSAAWQYYQKGNAASLRQLILALAELRRLFAKSPHFPRTLFAMLESIPGFDEDWTVKTTGAGGEDALLFFTTGENQSSTALAALAAKGWSLSSLKIADEGLQQTISSPDAAAAYYSLSYSDSPR